ncbi:hypothetical protein CGCA056_v010215 [Colletotrichum aenigma]|uniref:uncharacterized protein n=1 Tax=Colletotrichum aenigma TaxID=1215731 RepID=UPI0018731652|nr:uncharacterized protein CGCA056_v010215 [Colletotrichum aenigma]KAF5519653.1 hypothetical protein CGCA056_v010215 [Colletotrichum aenigma]
MAKWKREESEWYQNRTATSIIDASHCDQLVSVQGNSVSKSKDLRTVPYIQSCDDFHRRRTIQAYFDINCSGLEGLEETAFVASQTEPNHDAGIYKELVRLGDEASTLRKAVGQVNPGQGIIGFVLHTTCTEANAVSLKYTDFRYITLPNFFSICISAVTDSAGHKRAQEGTSMESPNSEFRASFAGMSYIGALSGFLEDGASDEDGAGERGAERDSDDEDDEDDGLVGYLEEANEE